MQLYFVRGDMFRLIIQPSSGQLTIERCLIILRPIKFIAVSIMFS